jgi:hypothetical protein
VRAHIEISGVAAGPGHAYGSIPGLASGIKPLWQQVLLFAAFLAAVLWCSATAYYLLEAPMQRTGRMAAKWFDGEAKGTGLLPELLPGEGHPDSMTSL